MDDITRGEPLELPGVDQSAQENQSKAVVSTAGGAALVGVGGIIASFLNYITNISMTHMVTPSIYGIFIEITAVAGVVSYIVKLGFDDTVLRFLSAYRAKGEWSLANGLTRFTVRATLIWGFVCAIVLFLLAPLLAHYIYHQEVYIHPLQEIALLIPLLGLQPVLSSGLQALKAIKWKVYVDNFVLPIATLILLFLFYLLGLRLEALIFATICGYVAYAIVARILLKKAMKMHVPSPTLQFVRMTWMGFAIPMCFYTMIYYFMSTTDVLFLGAFAAASQVALYGVAGQLSRVVLIPILSLSVVFPPLIGEYYARGEHKQLESMYKTVTRWAFSLSLPIFLCCLIFHNPILAIFGEKYITATSALMILSVATLIESAAGPGGYLLVMTGKSRIVLANAITTFIVNIGLVFLLVPRYTIIGAAIAAGLTGIIMNIAALVEIYWIMRIHPYRWDFVKPIFAGGIASVVGVLLLRVSPVNYGWLAIFIALGLVLSVVIVYVLVLALLGFGAEDMMVFDAVRAKLGKKKPDHS